MTNGFTVLDNSSKGSAVIEQVSFYGDQHLQLVDAVVVPIQYDAVGFSEGWPPAPVDLNQPGVQWDKRVPAVDALAIASTSVGLPGARSPGAHMWIISHPRSSTHVLCGPNWQLL